MQLTANHALSLSVTSWTVVGLEWTPNREVFAGCLVFLLLGEDDVMPQVRERNVCFLPLSVISIMGRGESLNWEGQSQHHKDKIDAHADEEVMREQFMLLNDCRLCGPHILQLRIQRNTSDGNCVTTANNFEDTWKSAEMPEVRDEEIDISYQKNRYPESRIC